MIAEVSSGEGARYAQALSLALVTALVLVLVFLLGSLIIVRSARRYRDSIERRRGTPTQSDDAWSLAGHVEDSDEKNAGDGEDAEHA